MISATRPPGLIASLVCDKAKDRTEYVSKDLVLTARVSAVGVPTIVAVLISASESFAEVVVVLVEPDIVRVIPVARVLVAERSVVVITPSVVSIRLACTESFFVSILDRVLDLLGPVGTRVVPRTSSVIAVVVIDIVVVAGLLKS